MVGAAERWGGDRQLQGANATSLAGPWTTYVSVNGSLAKVAIGGLTNGTTYYFRVGAHNAAGWGQYSWAIGAVPRTVPSAPGLTANSGERDAGEFDGAASGQRRGADRPVPGRPATKNKKKL